MPGTELGVVPGLRRTPGVLQALPDADIDPDGS
jgi:hypothetical protein